MKQPLPVSLTETECASLETFLHRGRANARTFTRARLLLKAAEGWSDAELVQSFDVCPNTVTRVRARFAEGGLEAVLQEKVQVRRRQALTGQEAAYLVAVACTPAPEGHDHWTVRLLADKAVELGFVEGISLDTISRLLKKTSSNPGSTSNGAFPASAPSL